MDSLALKALIQYLPAFIGAIFANIIAPPKTKTGMAAVWIVSVGCGAWFGPPLFAQFPSIGLPGCVLGASALGLVVLRRAARFIDEFDWARLLGKKLDKPE